MMRAAMRKQSIAVCEPVREAKKSDPRSDKEERPEAGERKRLLYYTLKFVLRTVLTVSSA